MRQKQWCHGKKVCSLRFPATYRGRKRYGLHLTAALGTGWQSHTWSDHLPKPLRSAEDWSGTSRCSSGKQQTQGSGEHTSSSCKDRQPRSVAERSLLLEHNDGIAFVEEAPRISTKRENQGPALGITGTLVDTVLGIMASYPSQWSQDTADEAKWTNVITRLDSGTGT